MSLPKFPGVHHPLVNILSLIMIHSLVTAPSFTVALPNHSGSWIFGFLQRLRGLYIDSTRANLSLTHQYASVSSSWAWQKQQTNTKALIFSLSLYGPSAYHSLSQQNQHQRHLVDQFGTAEDIHRVIKVTVQIGHRHQSSQARSAEAGHQQSPDPTRRHFGEMWKFQRISRCIEMCQG